MRLHGLPLRMVLLVGPLLFKAYMRFVFLTSRKLFHGFGPLWDMVERGETTLAGTWHQDVMLAAFAFRNKDIVTMVSMSRDGEIMSRVFRRCGFTPVRGSSSRRGIGAIKELIDYMKPRRGTFCAFAADGPRGPAKQAKKGMIFLAKHTRAPIFPVRCGAKRRILNRSWDETILPLPFNELVFLCGEPVSIPSEAGKNDLEAARGELEDKLNELTAQIEGYFKRDRRNRDEACFTERSGAGAESQGTYRS